MIDKISNNFFGGKRGPTRSVSGQRGVSAGRGVRLLRQESGELTRRFAELSNRTQVGAARELEKRITEWDQKFRASAAPDVESLKVFLRAVHNMMQSIENRPENFPPSGPLGTSLERELSSLEHEIVTRLEKVGYEQQALFRQLIEGLDKYRKRPSMAEGEKLLKLYSALDKRIYDRDLKKAEVHGRLNDIFEELYQRGGLDSDTLHRMESDVREKIQWYQNHADEARSFFAFVRRGKQAHWKLDEFKRFLASSPIDPAIKLDPLMERITKIDRQSARVQYNELKDDLDSLEMWDLPEELERFKEDFDRFLRSYSNLVCKLQASGRQDMLEKMEPWKARIQNLMQKMH